MKSYGDFTLIESKKPPHPLRGGQGQDAALEYQKILNHPGIVLNSLVGAKHNFANFSGKPT
jgi:hypothetical protein